MLNVLSGLALFSAAFALPLEQQQEQAIELAELADGTIGYLPVNSGWASFPFGRVGSETSIAMNLFCRGRLNITDLFCSGDQFAIYDNGVFVSDTSRPVFNDCKSNTTDPNYAQRRAEWSSDSIELDAGYHNITLKVLRAPYGYGTGAIRVDTRHRHHHDHHDKKHHHEESCNVKVCPVEKSGLVFVNTHVPRCQAEQVCRSMGLHLASIDNNNFMDATSMAFQCNGAMKQAWIDDWNGDKYSGSCLVLTTGNQAPGGAINVPSCCSERLPVICQKNPTYHPHVQYSCNDCHESCYCDRRHHELRRGHHGRRHSSSSEDSDSSRRSSRRSSSSSSSSDSSSDSERDRCRRCHHGRCRRCDSCSHRRRHCHSSVTATATASATATATATATPAVTTATATATATATTTIIPLVPGF